MVKVAIIVLFIDKCTNNFISLEQQNVFTPISYKYWDIKFNILIYDNETNQAMIGEVQFLFSLMQNECAISLNQLKIKQIIFQK